MSFQDKHLSKTYKNKALQLVSRFALPPNSLGYCGRDSAPERFKKCIEHGVCELVEEEVTKFIVLHPYLKTISTATKRSKYDHDVIESYCIGNDLLNEIQPEHYSLLLDNFIEQGVPDWFVDDLRTQQPKEFIPTHLFQVLHVGVGKASGSVPFNLESINSCMVRWGVVEKVSKGLASVSLVSLDKRKEKYITTSLAEEVPFSEAITPKLKKGDTIAVHWKQVIKKLTKEEVKKLEFWTNRVIEVVPADTV